MKEIMDKFKLQVESRMQHLNDSEEATKMSLIMPFFGEVLGYDVYNPMEFTAELTADISKKKGEKVDYAILVNGKPEIIVETKPMATNLRDKQTGQLQRYFHTTEAKIGILTNGLQYMFFADTQKDNVMDDEPFFIFDVLNYDKSSLAEISKFTKVKYDGSEILDVANQLKVVTLLKEKFNSFLANPDDDFVKLCVRDIHEGALRQTAIDEYRPLVKKSFNNFIKEQTENVIKRATDFSAELEEVEEEKSVSNIVTTDEELEFYSIVKGMLLGVEGIDIDKIVYRDTESYFGLLYTDNNRRWFTRASFKKTGFIKLYIRTEDKDKVVDLSNLSDLIDYKKDIINACLGQVK